MLSDFAREKSTSTGFTPNGVYDGIIRRVDFDAKTVWVELPRVAPGYQFGPLTVTTITAPKVGDKVACMFLEDRADDIIVLGVKLDGASPDYTVPVTCTDVTRPVNPHTGQIIYETNTTRFKVWDGNSWEDVTVTEALHALTADAATTATYATSAGAAASAVTASYATSSGAAASAVVASKWTTPRTLSLSGVVSGSVAVDGSGNVDVFTALTAGASTSLDARYVNANGGDTITGGPLKLTHTSDAELTYPKLELNAPALDIGYIGWNTSLGVGAPVAAGELDSFSARRARSIGTRIVFWPGTSYKAVTNKALTSNVATLTVVGHGFTNGTTVRVFGVDATFDGSYTITSVPTADTFTYAKTAANVPSQAATGYASNNTSVDYARGIGPGTLWDSVPTASETFRWYGGPSNVMSLSGSGTLTLISSGGGISTPSISGITSTTMVTNLNADLLDGIQGNAYLQSNHADNIMQRGTTASAAFNGANPSVSTGTINFPTAFGGTPTVVAWCAALTGNTTTIVNTTAVGAGSFSYRAALASGSSTSTVNIHWIAIGPA